jgi:trans-aconitate methyltransferase
MSYNYKTYWEGRFFTGDPNPDWMTEVSSLVIPGTVLDLGCGSGRFADCFDPDSYVGLDLNQENIDEALLNWPDHDFRVSDFLVDDWWHENWDNIFAWTVLEHVEPSEIKELAQKMKNSAKNIIFGEPSGVPNVDHCFKHDYESLFEVTKKVEVKPGFYLYQAKGHR